MRRSRGMTFVEVLTAMLVTMIIGGTAVMFLRSGLDLEMANTISASNQQSLRTPLLRLTPLVERAAGLEILTALPDADSLRLSEMVVYVADPADSKKLDSDQNNMYIRTRSGDSLVPGFSHITNARFDRVSLLPLGSLLDSKDHQAVRFTLTAENLGRELVYSTDIRSLNKIPVKGPDFGPMLKIDLHSVLLYPFIKYAELTAGGKVSSDAIPHGTTVLTVGTTIAGYFQVLSGSPASEFEYEWRLYSSINDIDRMKDYKVVGSDDHYADEKHYKDRFTSVDLSASPPTGTTAHTTPPYVLELSDAMVNKFIALAVREKGDILWVQSEWYKIAKKPAQGSSFWKDLIAEIVQDIKDGTTKTIFKGTKDAQVEYESPGGEEAYLSLRGKGVDGRPYLSKELEEKYFGQKDGKRDPEFCLENYTLWVDATVESQGGAAGWTALLNGNVIKDQVPDGAGNRPGDQSYGYGLQFDPGMEGLDHKNDLANSPEYFYQKSLQKKIDNVQGLIIRNFVGSTNTDPCGIDWVRRWKETTLEPMQEGPGKSFKEGPHRRYYLWSDVAYKNKGLDLLPGDANGGGYKDGFAVSADNVMSMRDHRFTTEVNIVVQTSKKSFEPVVTEPERIFCRVRVYDRAREYNERTKQWFFPEGTGRSKEMWYGLEEGKDMIWELPLGEKSSVDSGKRFERGDVCYKLKDMANEKITNYYNKNFWGYALAKSFGLRVWGGSGYRAKIYFVDIAKGLPLTDKLPWGTVVGDIIKPIEKGGNWNPDAPYQPKQPQE